MNDFLSGIRASRMDRSNIDLKGLIAEVDDDLIFGICDIVFQACTDSATVDRVSAQPGFTYEEILVLQTVGAALSSKQESPVKGMQGLKILANELVKKKDELLKNHKDTE